MSEAVVNKFAEKRWCAAAAGSLALRVLLAALSFGAVVPPLLPLSLRIQPTPPLKEKKFRPQTLRERDRLLPLSPVLIWSTRWTERRTGNRGAQDTLHAAVQPASCPARFLWPRALLRTLGRTLFACKRSPSYGSGVCQVEAEHPSIAVRENRISRSISKPIEPTKSGWSTWSNQGWNGDQTHVSTLWCSGRRKNRHGSDGCGCRLLIV